MIWWFFRRSFVENKSSLILPQSVQIPPQRFRNFAKTDHIRATIPKQNAILAQTAHIRIKRRTISCTAFAAQNIKIQCSEVSWSEFSEAGLSRWRDFGRADNAQFRQLGRNLAKPRGKMKRAGRANLACSRSFSEAKVSKWMVLAEANLAWIMQVCRNSAKLGRKMADFRFWGGRFWRSQFLMKRSILSSTSSNCEFCVQCL